MAQCNFEKSNIAEETSDLNVYDRSEGIDYGLSVLKYIQKEYSITDKEENASKKEGQDVIFSQKRKHT